MQRKYVEQKDAELYCLISELVPLLVAVLVLQLVRGLRELLCLHPHLSRSFLQFSEAFAALKSRLKNVNHTFGCNQTAHDVAWQCNCSASDSRSNNHEFVSWHGCYQVTTLGKLFILICLHYQAAVASPGSGQVGTCPLPLEFAYPLKFHKKCNII